MTAQRIKFLEWYYKYIDSRWIAYIEPNGKITFTNIRHDEEQTDRGEYDADQLIAMSKETNMKEAIVWMYPGDKGQV